MGLLDFLRRKDQPLDLFGQLMKAVRLQDSKAFAILCQQNEQEILESFSSWRKLPESFLKNPKGQQEYVGTLIQVAQAFEQAGHRQLMDLLVGSPHDNPILNWQDDLADANPDKDTYGILRINEALLLHGEKQKSEAIEILSALAIDRDSTMATSCLAKETLAKLIE